MLTRVRRVPEVLGLLFRLSQALGCDYNTPRASASASGSRSSAPDAAATAATVPLADVFVAALREHSTVVNTYIRSEPSLLHESWL